MDDVKKKKWYLRWWMFIVYAMVVLTVLASLGDAKKDAQVATENTSPATTTAKASEPTPTPVVADNKSKEKAQADLDEFMALAKKAKLVTSYEFSDSAAVVYVGSVWYTQTAIQKKDFMAFVANLKKEITGYRHFEVRDAYSDEKVAEVTSFSGSLEVYK